MLLPLGMKPVVMDSVELQIIDGELFEQLLGTFVERKAEPQMESEAENTTEDPGHEEKTMDEVLTDAIHQFLRLAMPLVNETVSNHSASNKEIETPPDQSAMVDPTSEPSDKMPAGQHKMEEKMESTSKLPIIAPIESKNQQPSGKRETVIPFERQQEENHPLKKGEDSKELAFILTPTIKQDLILTPVAAIPKQVTINFQQADQLTQELGETMKVAIQDIPAEGSKVVHVTLLPESFGELDIELTWQDNQVEAVITVEKEEIKQQLLEHMDVLKDHLPKNPIVQTITIEVKAPLALFQQPFQERKRMDMSFSSKQRSNRERQKKDEEEWVESLPAGHVSLYI